MTGGRMSGFAMLMAGAVLVGAGAPASAQERETYQFDLPAQDLGDALRAVAAKAGLELYASAGDLNGVAAPTLHGTFTAREAVERLVRGTKLSVRFDKGAVIVRGRSEVADANGSSEKDIIVTGTQIRGTPPAAPVTVVTAQEIKDAGQADLGEVARSLPMNFGGGQNPGIGNTQGAANENANVNAASTFNLRGIGPNATLTLLNGNRLSYSGVSAAVDVSSIPVAAVLRVEIVADGASAIYGSDAVAGVVNIILKPDYSGLTTSARIGGSTDGGNFQQQYSIVGGSNWGNGGFIATYDFFKNTAIDAGDRSYASASNSDSTLYPAIERHSFLASAHQKIADGVTLSTDFIYKFGHMDSATGYILNQALTYNGFTVHRSFETLGIVPTLNVDLSSKWTMKVTGFYGTDDTTGLSTFYTSGSLSRLARAVYDNRSLAFEANAQGPIFSLSAGEVRLAVGAGVKSYNFVANTDATHVRQTRNNYFGYAEIFAPLVSPAQGVSFIRRASISAAVRVESYSDAGRIATPKFGVIYEPFEGLSLKGSWGRSFKLPTLYQQYSGYSAVLLPVSGYGSTFPAGSTYVIALGSNDQEKAERSENWVVTAEVRPARGLELSASYFHIDYTDRVAPPLTSIAGVLTNPVYASLITSSPTASQISTVSSGASGGLQNGTGAPLNPANVVAIVDARDRNVARQLYHGIDFSARYHIDLGSQRSLSFTGGATWLESWQQLISGLPRTDLAGRIFFPPHFKGRASVTYVGRSFTLASFVNYAGGVTDARRSSAVEVHSLTTVDLTGSIKLGGRMSISVNALNLFNAKPARIYTASPSDTPFDTTNYSAAGRFLGLTLTRSW
ncbi:MULTISPECIES: TonB-dependent receptor [unclassified Sphingomonas]|uniref:TonB-dependent receptor n=1 Tax=unclassified Sphingomonas TaxID=196159 RepID=UPI000AE13AD6|nr:MULTISPECIES: TonB-dependent receptor [unclassified Sphingomonas]